MMPENKNNKFILMLKKNIKHPEDMPDINPDELKEVFEVIGEISGKMANDLFDLSYSKGKFVMQNQQKLKQAK